MSSGPWLDERQQRAWRTFIAVQARLRAALSRELQRDSGLSWADYEILAQLSEAPGRRLRAYEIGTLTGWEKSRLSHHISRMVQRGLLTRAQCDGSSRYFDVVLTAHGQRVIEEAAPKHVAHVRELFVEAMAPDRLEALGAACEAIGQRLLDTGRCAASDDMAGEEMAAYETAGYETVADATAAGQLGTRAE